MVEHDVKAQFLEVGYDRVSFLVNRCQFSNSMFIDKEKHVKSKLKYFDTMLILNGEKIITFNFDYYVKDLFNFEQNNSRQLALLSHVSLFSDKHQHLFQKLTDSASVPLSKTTLGIKVGSQAKITKVNLEEIKLPPSKVKRRLKHEGLLGIRFVSPELAEYFLDLETLVFSSIIKTYRTHS